MTPTPSSAGRHWPAADYPTEFLSSWFLNRMAKPSRLRLQSNAGDEAGDLLSIHQPKQPSPATATGSADTTGTAARASASLG